jgi:hypothetical protein
LASIAPQSAQGKRGYYSFDVGSWHIVSLNSNSEARGAGSFGVAKLVLDGRYSWAFVPAAGTTFTDRGEANCV